MSLEALAAQAGNTVVAAAVTDAWGVVRDRLSRLFGRGHPDAAVERRLDVTRGQLAAASVQELDGVRSALQAQWLTRVMDFLEENPAAEVDLRALVEDVRALLPERPVSASGYSLSAGRDISLRSWDGGTSIGAMHVNIGAPGPSTPDRSGS